MFRISDPSDSPHATVSNNEDYDEKHISPATVSEKELTLSVTGSVSKSTLTEHGAEPSSAQTGKRMLAETSNLHIDTLMSYLFVSPSAFES